MVLISNPRRFSPLMAKSSFKKKVIGQVATLLKASTFVHDGIFFARARIY